MTLRATAVHLRRPPSWRGSGDEAHWRSLMVEGEVAPQAASAPRAPRPQSAIEGGRMDTWLQQLERIHSGRHRSSSVQDKVTLFNERTASMPALNKEPVGAMHGQQGIPLYSRDYPSSGGASQCESSPGSQDSLQAGRRYPLERTESRERARFTQAPGAEQGRLSSLAPVTIGWLPVKRRATVSEARSQNPSMDHAASQAVRDSESVEGGAESSLYCQPLSTQVKMKMPITPTLQNNSSNANGFRHLDGEVSKSSTSSGASGVRMWRAPDKGSPVVQQVSEKVKSSTKEGDSCRPLTWQALKRSWTTNKASTLCGESQSSESQSNNLPTAGKPPLLMKASSVEGHRPHNPLHRTTSLHPVKPPTETNGITTGSAVATLKGSFSSITICSRKVTRSASLPGSNNPTHHHPDEARSSPSLPLGQQTMDPEANLVSLRRKATIVKVTEHRVTSSPGPSESLSYGSPGNHESDTVVHRNKATIIKVTEHRQSYSPARTGSRTGRPEYRHSYTEGLYTENSMWHRGPRDPSKTSATPSLGPLEYPERTSYSLNPNTSASVPLRSSENNGGPLHRSTISLFVSNTPAVAASTQTSPKVVKERQTRVSRPLSCYDNMFGHTEDPSKGTSVPHPTPTRKWSFGHTRGTDTNPLNQSNGSVFSPVTAVRENVQAPEPNAGGSQTVPPPQDAQRRPSLTLIKAPDTNSRQSAEEVLALNAAAIIANIKLQRRLSKEKIPNGNSGKDSDVAPRGNIVRDMEWLCTNQSPVQRSLNNVHPNLAQPLHSGPERSAQTVSIQEALARSRPDFISRSRGRVRELERRAQERRELGKSEGRQWSAVLGHKRGPRPASQTDIIFKPGYRAITGREMQFSSKRSYNTLQEVKRKKEEERRREVCLTNRHRAEVFKKKLLDEILQRDK